MAEIAPAMTCPTIYAIALKAALEFAFSPDPQQRVPTGRTPDYPSALPWATRSKVQPVRDVEILDGRAAS